MAKYICIWNDSRREKMVQKKYLEEVTHKTFPKLMKDLTLQTANCKDKCKENLTDVHPSQTDKVKDKVFSNLHIMHFKQDWNYYIQLCSASFQLALSHIIKNQYPDLLLILHCP